MNWEIYDWRTGRTVETGFHTREDAQGIADDLCEKPWSVRQTSKEDTMALNLATLTAEAQRRYDKMSGNPDHHGDPDLTYSKFVLDAVAELELKLTSDASTRLETEPVVSYSDKDRKRLLAAKVQAGDFAA